MRELSFPASILGILVASATACAQIAGLGALAQKNGIYYGCAVGSAFWSDQSYKDLIARECNIIVSENDMKFNAIEPQRGRFNWQKVDDLIAFCQQHNIKLRGHTFVWHQAVPGWLSSGSFNRQEMLSILTTHIDSLAGHCKGKILEWDAVNEAIDDGNGNGLRSSIWKDRIGNDYIDSAFAYARRADPAALLFYNDYSAEGSGSKSDAVYNLVKGLKQRGVPIDGVGFQCHFTVNGLPSATALTQNIQRLAALGLKVSITELDIRIQMPADNGELQAQATSYKALMTAFLANRPACAAFLTWGITDKYSWVPGFFSGWGAALPFNESYQPKPAYDSLKSALTIAAATELGQGRPASDRITRPGVRDCRALETYDMRGVRVRRARNQSRFLGVYLTKASTMPPKNRLGYLTKELL